MKGWKLTHQSLIRWLEIQRQKQGEKVAATQNMWYIWFTSWSQVGSDSDCFQTEIEL